MPSFHWPLTSIHENMWNSKSCPEGLPHRKIGAMASRQTPANTNAREIGFLSKWPLAYLKPLISCRDAACRVSTGGRALRRDEQFCCIRKFSEKLTGAKSFRRGCRGNLRSRPQGLGRHQRRDVALVPVFIGSVFAGSGGAIVRT